MSYTRKDLVSEHSNCKMEEAALQRLQPEEYLRRFLEYQLRPDGRQLTELRSPSICKRVLKQACIGSAMVSAGRSRFVAGVIAAICPPHSAAPQSGRIMVNVEFPKTSTFNDAVSSTYQAAIAADTSVRVSQILTNSEVFDSTQLVITSGSAVWVLYVNVVCLEFDGNPLDWALCAAVAALEDTRLPSVRWCTTGKWWRVCSDAEAKGLLESAATHSSSADLVSVGRDVIIQHRPVCVTIAKLLDTYWVTDPSMQEEEFGESVTVWKLQGKDSAPFQMLRRGGTPLLVAAELHKLFPLFQIALDTMERELHNASSDVLTGNLFEVCNLPETAVDDELSDAQTAANLSVYTSSVSQNTLPVT